MRKFFAILILIFFLVGVSLLYKHFFVSTKQQGVLSEQAVSTRAQSLPHTYNSTIKQDDQSISYNENALFSYVKKFGPKQAVSHLAAIDEERGLDCHQTAHKLGKFAYEIYGEKSFSLCSESCHSGCYHGAIESFFKEHGTENMQANLNIICGSELNQFFSHQCIHGVGHGLMAWSDYEIHDALKQCDLLPKGQASCYSGVFMENIIGAVPFDSRQATPSGLIKHYTKYLNDDPNYPCTVVEKKYQGECYFYQTSRMVQLFHADFVAVSNACQKVPLAYQKLCFESMGRDVDGYTQQNPEKSIKLCLAAPSGKFRIACLNGAVQDTFWESRSQDTALRFCKILSDVNEKNECYWTISLRAKQVLFQKEAREQFCKKVESPYIPACHLAMEK